MDLVQQHVDRVNRRSFFGRSVTGLGVAALASLLGDEAGAETKKQSQPGLPGVPHFAAKAKRVVYLWQGGAPSHVDLFDPKPVMEKHRLKELPESVRGTTRLSTMTAGYKSWPVVPAIKPFQKYGKSGIEMSSMLPHTGSIADEICLVRSMYTD